jgi:hypothetical protein
VSDIMEDFQGPRAGWDTLGAVEMLVRGPISRGEGATGAAGEGPPR